MVTPDQFIGAIIALAIAIGLTPLVRHVAMRKHWLDQPNERSSHSEPTPRLGGVAFIVATVIGVAAIADAFEWWMLGIGLGAILVAVTGLLDDLEPIGPGPKFLAQAGAATIAVWLLEPRILMELPMATVTLSPVVSAWLAVVWIVSVINAFNFLDGLDGLAAGVALVTAIVLAGMLPGSAPMMIPFAAALGGFLLWNTAPATIFMGDVGSQFVGYLLATAVLMPGPTDTGAVPVLFVFVPVLGDAAVTIVRRLAAGHSPFKADRNHVFHGVVAAGLGQRAVANIYYGLTALTSLAGFAYLHAGDVSEAALLGVVALAVAAVAFRVIELPSAPNIRKAAVTEARTARQRRPAAGG